MELSLQNALEGGSLIAICSAIGANKSVFKCDLSRNEFNLSALQALFESMRLNTTLKELNLNECLLGDSGVDILSDMISNHPQFAAIGFRKNKFSDKVKRNTVKYI